MTVIRIEFVGGAEGHAVRARVAARLKDIVDSVPVKAASARATFSDENGPKGGEALRCALEVRLPRRPTFRVEKVAATSRLALDGALVKLARQLDRHLATTRESRRRPKKYFVARRALTA